MRFTLILLTLAACSTAEPTDDGQVSPSLETLWTAGHPVGASFSPARKGAVDGERFYTTRERVGDGAALVAYDRRTGAEAWRQTVLGPGTVVPAGDRVYCPGDFLYALDAETGREIWRYGTGRIEDTFQLVDAAADDDRVYAGVAGAADGTGRAPSPGSGCSRGQAGRASSSTPSSSRPRATSWSRGRDPPVFSGRRGRARPGDRCRAVAGRRRPETDREGGDLALVGDLAVRRFRRSRGRRGPVEAIGRVDAGLILDRLQRIQQPCVLLGGVFAVDGTGERVWSWVRGRPGRGALPGLGVLLGDPEAITGRAARPTGCSTSARRAAFTPSTARRERCVGFRV